MEKKKYLGLVAILCICMCLLVMTESSWSGQSICFPEAAKYRLYQDEGTLIGLKAIEVKVFCWSGKEEEKYGLTKQTNLVLQRDVESLLSQNGIKVLLPEETFGKPRQPSLHISVSPTIIDDCRKAAAYVIIELRQFAFLPRLPNAGCYAITWSDDSSTVCSANRLFNNVRRLVAEQVDEFCKVYLAANRKESKMITGTVRYLYFEGGFYGLAADNGDHYDPINLPAEYRKDGMRVKFQVKEKKDMASIRMWGKIVELIKIEKQ